jgi:phosphoribosylanthranilate isomerase
MKTRFKICGLTRREDVEAAVNAGASYLGFIFYAKSPRNINPERVREISRDLPEGVKKVGVFVNYPLEEIERIVKLCALDVVQLHGDESPEFARQLQGVEVWKALNLRSADDVKYAETYPADLVLIDAMSKEQRGGTGKLSNWALATDLNSKRPIILAGGISPDNVMEAIEKVKPAIVDVNSGVETAPGIKDKDKISLIGKIIRQIL